MAKKAKATVGWRKGQTPNFTMEMERRKQNFLRIYKDKDLISGSKIYYKTRPVEWIMDWAVTYDPRNAGTDKPTLLPFVLFKRQIEFIEFLHQLWKTGENGAIEKCRDVGATWCAAAFSVWLWIYHEGSSVGWGSRKEILVDRIGDPDSIFEKIRALVKNLPAFMKPAGYVEKEHASYMKLLNPETGSTVVGEAGDNIGRGGRKTIYFKDESAYYLHPESIQAALDDNTNVQIDISSVNGPDTLFQRKIDTGETWTKKKKIGTGTTRVFIFDWRDHPLKTKEWYDKRRAKAEREGMLHKFAQEVDRDPSMAVEKTLFKSEWIEAALDAHYLIPGLLNDNNFGSMDVADEGSDNHALAIRSGMVLRYLESWHFGDTGKAARESLFKCRLHGVTNFSYDSIGVGAGVKAEINRTIEENEDNVQAYVNNLIVSPWNASESPLFKFQHYIDGDEMSPTNDDMFSNLTSQAWWNLRCRFERTWDAITNGTHYDPEELISISSEMADFVDLKKQLLQVRYDFTAGGKIKIVKKRKGGRSPDKADAVKMCFFPVVQGAFDVDDFSIIPSVASQGYDQFDQLYG